LAFWRTLDIDGEDCRFASLSAADELAAGAISRLPLCLKVLIENLLFHADRDELPPAVQAILHPDRSGEEQEIAFYPSRVLMPDSSGLPLIADLAALRDEALRRGIDPQWVNPQIPVDLVVDHSVIVDVSGVDGAAEKNLEAEIAQNEERYRLIKWAEGSFDSLNVVPPGNGICHQLNLERLAKVVVSLRTDGVPTASFETLVGMDSHTPMINSIGIVGWGVGGIEAATAMLGEPIGLTVPRVVGCRLIGELPKVASTTDLALTVTQRLRKHDVVGAFVEFFGPGARALVLPQRATLSNMAPEYGATLGFFAVDRETLRYLAITGRPAHHLRLVETYAKAQGAWADAETADPAYTELVEIDLSEIEASVSGPSRPQDRVSLGKAPESFAAFIASRASGDNRQGAAAETEMADGSVVIAAITSCTNTSNPSVMIEAGLLARNAVRRGLKIRPWIKTALAPGSHVVADYLRNCGLQADLDALGFNVAGFGCTTCMGNSGSLKPQAVAALEKAALRVCAVLSGNRNFEGRIHNSVAANYLMSPALVIAYALAGSITIDLTCEPLGKDSDGRDVYLRELSPDPAEIDELTRRHVTRDVFEQRYSAGFAIPQAWTRLATAPTAVYPWQDDSTYIRRPPFLDLPDDQTHGDIVGARALLILGDTVTTDHISPVSKIKPDSAAGRYLRRKGVAVDKLDSFMARRANHDVMLRGTFANPHLVNDLAPGLPGGMTRHASAGEAMAVDEAAALYAREKTPLIIIAGAEYGTGSSRDWAAKGTRLLGIRAVVAESFERIHRSNLVGTGVLPLQFPTGVSRKNLDLSGSETYDIRGLSDLMPGQSVQMIVRKADGSTRQFDLLCRIDTERELAWYEGGGILPLASKNLALLHSVR
jgi:aconitate hydratase